MRKNHLRWEEKLSCTLQLRLCFASKQRSSLLIQSEVQVLISAMLTVWHRNKVPLLPLLLHAEQGCLQGESCLVQSAYGSIKPQERACWTLVNRSSGNRPSKSMNEHFHPPVYAVTSKKEHFQRLFIPWPLHITINNDTGERHVGYCFYTNLHNQTLIVVSCILVSQHSKSVFTSGFSKAADVK